MWARNKCVNCLSGAISLPNRLPESYSWSKNDQANFAETHWSHDPGYPLSIQTDLLIVLRRALNLAKSVAKELKLPLVHSNYRYKRELSSLFTFESRLLCDVNRPIVSDTMFRRTGDGKNIDLNRGTVYYWILIVSMRKDLTEDEEIARLKKYYLSYYYMLRNEGSFFFLYSTSAK